MGVRVHGGLPLSSVHDAVGAGRWRRIYGYEPNAVMPLTVALGIMPLVCLSVHSSERRLR